MTPSKNLFRKIINYQYGIAIILAVSALLVIFQFTVSSLAVTAFLFLSSLGLSWKLSSWHKQVSKNLAQVTDLEATANVEVHVGRIEKKEQEATEFIVSLSKNEFPADFQFLQRRKGLGASLISLKDKLEKFRAEDEKRNWAQGGLAEFSKSLKSGSNLQEFSTIVISYLVKYVNANQGGLYILVEEDGDAFLELNGCYAYHKKKFQQKRVAAGDGLLGQCYYERSVIFLTDVPSDYVQITSGLGEATPRSIVILPLLFDSKFYGAVELASFEKLQQYQINFLTKICESVAAEIATRKSSYNNEKLLQESQKLSNELQAQDEEIRQQMEELTATQEEMARKQAELDSVFSAINNTVASLEFDVDGKILTANSIFLGVSGFAASDISNRTYRQLLSSAEREKPQHAIMWENLRQRKFFSGEFKLVDKHGHEMWLSGTFNPILNPQGDVSKVIMIAHFTTQEKHKQVELTSTVNAIKHSFPYIELNPDYSCKSANERFLTLFGIKRIDLKSKNFCSFLDKESSDSYNKGLLQISDSSHFELNLKFMSPVGRMIFRTTFTAIKDFDGKVSRILVIFSDQQQMELKITAVA